MSTNATIPTLDVSGLKSFLAAGQRSKTPVMIYGAPGVGKSGIIEQFGASIGYAVLDVRLSYMLPETIGPIYYPDASGRRTIALKPAIIAQIEELHAATGKPVLVFLDEITTASSETLKASLELLLKGAIAGFRPSCEIYVAAAGNRPEDTPEAIYLPVPTRTRFFSALFAPTLNDTGAYIASLFPKMPLAKAVAAFLGTAEARRLASGETIADGIEPIFTPRGLVKALEAVQPEASKMGADAALSDPVVSMVLASAIGPAFVARLASHVALNSALADASGILKNPKKAEVPTDPQAVTAQLQALAQAVEKNGFSESDMTAFMDYVDRCQPEATRIWAASERASVHSAIGATMRGRRMLADWGIAQGNDTGRVRRTR